MSPSPLTAGSLDAEQIRLLRLIARPVFDPGLVGGDPLAPVWPPWRWVSRVFHQERGGADGNAADVFATLPSVARSWAGPGDLGRRYGLVWREHAAPATPIPDERVGLSIAGLRRAGKAGLGSRIPDVPERLLQVLVELDDYEMNQLDPPTLEVGQLPHDDVSLLRFAGQMTDTALGGLGEQAVAAVLQAEYFAAPGLFSRPTDVIDPDTGQVQSTRTAWWVRLGNEGFKMYRGLSDVDSYLERIWETACTTTSPPSPAPAVPTHYLDRILLPATTEPATATRDVTTTDTPAMVADQLDLHDRVVTAVAATWGLGLYSDAVFAVFRDVENRVRTINRERGWAPKHTLDVFSANNRTPELDTSSVGAGPEQADDERSGFHSLIRGAMSALRNPHAHGDPLPATATEAVEYLALASLLHRRIDTAENRLPPPRSVAGRPQLPHGGE